MGMLQQLTGRKLKTVALENECIARIYRSGRGAMAAAGTPCHRLYSVHLRHPKEIKTELRFRRMLDPWITFRHTLPACARK